MNHVTRFVIDLNADDAASLAEIVARDAERSGTIPGRQRTSTIRRLIREERRRLEDAPRKARSPSS